MAKELNRMALNVVEQGCKTGVRMQCTKPVRLIKNLDLREYPEGLLVPCGKCLACRIAKRKEWSMRCLHELDSWNNNGIFVTLTYNDKSMPKNDSLRKKDLQNFIKRLREYLRPRTIRYFACGEYGEPEKIIISKTGLKYKTKGERPHYHVLIYGMSLEESDKEIIRKAWQYCDWDKLEASTNGTPFGLAEPDSIRYVAQYIDKKLSGDEAKAEYQDKGREAVFKVQSLGIGLEYVLKNMEQLINNESITLFGVNQSFPRYYLKKLGLEKSEFRKKGSVEKEMKLIKKITGLKVTDNELYRNSSASDYMKFYEQAEKIKIQKDKSLKAKCNLKQKKI